EQCGKTSYFCSAHCLGRFRKDPEHFLAAIPVTPPASSSMRVLTQIGSAPAEATRTPAAQADERHYVCPMCPEVRQVGPGPCPTCGMALEPESPLPTTKVEYTCPMHPEI